MKKGQRQCLTSPDRQLRKHEKTVQKPCSGWSCGWSCNGRFGGSSGLRSARSRNSPTPAGFKPNLSKNQPPKNCLTSPSDTHKKEKMKKGQRQCLTSPDRQLRKHEKTMQKPCSGWSCNGTFGGSSGLRSARSRNSQTPAGFKPNLSKNQPPKKCLNVAFGRPNNASQGAAKPGQKYGNFSGSLGLGRIEFKGPQSALRHACETATPQQDSNVVF